MILGLGVSDGANKSKNKATVGAKTTVGWVLNLSALTVWLPVFTEHGRQQTKERRKFHWELIAGACSQNSSLQRRPLSQYKKKKVAARSPSLCCRPMQISRSDKVCVSKEKKRGEKQ